MNIAAKPAAAPSALRFFLVFAMIVLVLGCNRAEDASPQIILPGAARTLDFPGALTTVLLPGGATEGDVAFLEVLVAPRSFGAPPHLHHHEDEYFYVLEGEVEILSQDRVVAAPAGAFAALTREHLHAYWNASDEPARLLVAIAPGGFAAFFDRVVIELQERGAVGPEGVGETIARVGREWGIEVHPEKVPEAAKPFLPR